MTDSIKYLITDRRSEFVIELPRDWKVTFSSVNPAAAGSRHDGYCVRVWERKDVLRAVFCDVLGIRDLSIPLARKVERQTGSAAWTHDSTGGFSREENVAVESEFVLEPGAGPF